MAVIEGKAESRIKLDEGCKSYAPDGSNFRICRKETGYQIRSLKTGNRSECLQNGRSDSIKKRRGIHEQTLPIAVQVYSVREEAERDFAGTMKKRWVRWATTV